MANGLPAKALHFPDPESPGRRPKGVFITSNSGSDLFGDLTCLVLTPGTASTQYVISNLHNADV